MQDRFKFRFFDKKENFLIDENTDPDKCIKLYDKDEWWWCAEHGLTTVLDYFDHCSYIQSRDFVIMQCTGLKDKNGKLIYEGDILGGIYGNLYIHYCKDCMQFQLKAKGYGCMACNGDIHWIEVVEDNKKLEVIGNIYEDSHLIENPKLLESN